MVLESGPPATNPDAIERSAQSDTLAGYKLDTPAARDLGKLTPDGNWSLVPGAEGSCIVSPDGASGCATRTDFDRRGVQLIRVSDAAPAKLSKEELAAARAGRQLIVPRKVSMAGAASIGVAPDGVRTVRIVNERGEVARAEVKNNAYVIDGAAREASRLELVAADGSVVTSVPVG